MRRIETEKDEYAEFIREHWDEIISICSIAGTSVGRFYEALRDMSDKIAETGKQIEEDGFCTGRGWPCQLVPDDGFCDKGKRREE